MHRGASDLSQIRPSAELDPPIRPGRAPRRRPLRQRPAGRRGRSLIGRIGIGFSVLAAFVAVGASAFFYVVSPTELVRDQLIRQVKANTGRTLSINGAARFLLYPSIGVSLGDVTLSEPPAMGGKAMLQARRIDVSVALMPLFSREVLVEHVALVEPSIELRIDEAGRENWSFAADRQPARYAAAGLVPNAGEIISDHDGGSLIVRTVAPAQAGGLPDAVKQIELRSIALTRARIRYIDARSQTHHALENLNLRLSGRRLSDPMRAIGDLVWQGEKVSFDARLDAPLSLLGETAAKTRLALAGAPLAAGFEGTIKLKPSFEARGAVRFDGTSVAAAAAWLGTRLPNGGPLGGFRGTGELVASTSSVALNQASILLGKTRMTGIVVGELRKARPYISAGLQITDLDLDALSAGFAEAESVKRTSVTAPLAEAGDRLPTTGIADSQGEGPPQSIEDLLRRYPMPRQEPGVAKFAPQVRGYRAREGWSDAPIDVASLGVVDAKARVTIDRLKVAGLDIDRTVTRLALTDRRLEVTIDDLRLYGGSGKGIVRAGPGSQGVTLGGNLTIGKVAIQPLLKDAAGFETLAGQGDIQLAISGAGASQQAIAQSLTGTGNLKFENGAIVGWNLAKILRGLSQGQFTGLDAVATETTDFSELAATFKIAGGNAVTDDLKLVSPLLRVAGQGRIGIGQRDLDMSLKPKLVSSLAGQGGPAGAQGLEIPVRLKGPWRAPRIVPDFGSIARDPNQIVERARDLSRTIQGGNFGDIVRGALGGGGGSGGDARQEGGPANPGNTGAGDGTGGSTGQDLIKRFLR